MLAHPLKQLLSRGARPVEATESAAKSSAPEPVCGGGIRVRGGGKKQMLMGCTICSAMSGSGPPVGMPKSFRAGLTRKGRPMATLKYCGAALGASIQGSSACRTVAGSIQRTVVAMSAFVVRGNKIPLLFSFFLLLFVFCGESRQTIFFWIGTCPSHTKKQHPRTAFPTTYLPTQTKSLAPTCYANYREINFRPECSRSKPPRKVEASGRSESQFQKSVGR